MGYNKAVGDKPWFIIQLPMFVSSIAVDASPRRPSKTENVPSASKAVQYSDHIRTGCCNIQYAHANHASSALTLVTLVVRLFGLNFHYRIKGAKIAFVSARTNPFDYMGSLSSHSGLVQPKGWIGINSLRCTSVFEIHTVQP